MSLRSVKLLDALLARCSAPMLTSESEEKSSEVIPTRVLSIQSTVVFGYVGNKAAMPALQLHGFDVSPLNTVQFSNHVGYGNFKGTVTTKKEMDDLIQGLEMNKLDQFECIISGYMGSIDCLSHLPSIIAKLRDKSDSSSSSSLFYVCDPVMADNGRLYSESFKPFPEIYRTKLIPLAQLITPNQTEAGILLNLTLNSLEDCYRACNQFHKMGVRFVVITSAEFESSKSDDSSERMLNVVFSDSELSNQFGHLMVPKLDAYVSGTGDMTSALIYSWLVQSDYSLTEAVEKTMATMQSIIARTLRLKSNELIVVSSGSITDILNPKVVHRAKTISFSEL